jgi:hypothetical protein
MDHPCTFDYFAAGQAQLLKTMSTPVIAAKLETI